MLFPRAPLSLAATAGALIGADFHFDLIRPGVGLYGSGGLDAGNPSLSTAATIEAPILQVREVEPGETFGYGATFTAAEKMRTATVALGYADGYLRSLSGRGYGVLGGGKRPILGRVSMDLIIIDVTGCAEAQPGDGGAHQARGRRQDSAGDQGVGDAGGIPADARYPRRHHRQRALRSAHGT